MICPDLANVNQADPETTIRDFRCKRWRCDKCEQWNCQKLYCKAISGQPNSFLTLTSVLGSRPTADEAARDLRRAWVNLRKAAARELGIKRLPFIAIFEATKAGWPHLHILMRAPFIEHAWISAHMAKWLGSPVVYIERVSEQKGGAAYLSGYGAKRPHQFTGCKRYWASHDYSLQPKEEASPKGTFGERWTRDNLPRPHLVAVAVAHGAEVAHSRKEDRWATAQFAIHPCQARPSEARVWSAKPTAEPPRDMQVSR